MAQLIRSLLNEAVLGFLALLSFFLLITPSVFSLSPEGTAALAVAEYGIVLMFALEYVASWTLASDKGRFALDRWRLLDALIIVAALVPLFPAGPDFLRNSPALRLLRLGRVALLGTRSSLALTSTREAPVAKEVGPRRDPKVRALGAAGDAFEEISWEAGLARIGTSEPDWLSISGVTEDHLVPIAAALGVPVKAVRGLFQSSVPRFGRLERFSALFVRYPLPMETGRRLVRTPVLLVGSADNVVVLSREFTDLEERVEECLSGLDAGTPRMVRATVGLLDAIVRANTQVVETLESMLFGIEADQATLRDASFIARTFDLRADILRVRSSLKHLKSVMRDLSRGDLALGGSEGSNRELFRLLEDDANDLYEGIEDLRESLQALVDLRLNVSSFQMNQVMRLLALLTALALIPATAGGLLGMNLADAPWPGTLAQVAFGVAAGMALSLYVFVIKGWLR